MESSLEEITTILGTSLGGGYYAGRIKIGDQPFALVVAPKAAGEHDDAQWIARSKDVPAAHHYGDGLANTHAMAEAGSKLAQWALRLQIGGFDDWYLPSLDELEICYRNLKPSTAKNSSWARSGINQTALQPTGPYTPDAPAQTLAEAFQADGAEAFAQDWYWSSTRHASASGYAWFQNFNDGYQDFSVTHLRLRARAVRRLPL